MPPSSGFVRSWKLFAFGFDVDAGSLDVHTLARLDLDLNARRVDFDTRLLRGRRGRLIATAEQETGRGQREVDGIPHRVSPGIVNQSQPRPISVLCLTSLDST